METPLGRFYVIAKFRPTAPILGAYGFETSAYSKLSEWPGGGVVGIHGTNTPSLLGQAVSHGCVRVANEAILRLKELVPVGTPIRIGVAVHGGRIALTTVGPPGLLSSSSRPPSSRSRSRIPTTPIPLWPSASGTTLSGSKPWPSSRISMQTPSSLSTSSTTTVELPLCWRTLLSASCSTRRSAIRCDALSASNDPPARARSRYLCAAQRRQLARDRARQRQLQERARLERVGEIAQILVQLGELRLEVAEAADDRVAVLAAGDRQHLLAQQADVLRQGVHLLQGAIVEVEAEPDEQALVRGGEPGLVRAHVGRSAASLTTPIRR